MKARLSDILASWVCRCGKSNAPWMVACESCGEEKPKEATR